MARADDCTGETRGGGRFATCFDPGNRVVATAGTSGLGGEIAVRHVLTFDDEPDLTWKLEHRVLAGRAGGFEGGWSAALYGGRYLRHARDGHIVLPFSVGRKIFLPFDIGAEAEVGRIDGRFGDDSFEIGVMRSAALIDLSRSQGFRRRLAVGAMVEWSVDVELEPWSVTRHVVAPFSLGVVDARAESSNGRSIAAARVVAGRAWSTSDGWRGELAAELSLERVVLAVNDRPVSVVLGARYRSRDDELRGLIGVQVALFQRADRRVNLRPLRASR